jgi:hypothetical protein
MIADAIGVGNVELARLRLRAHLRGVRSINVAGAAGI